MENALVSRNCNCLGCLNNTFKVRFGHFAALQSDYTVRIMTVDMATGDTDTDGVHLTTRHKLCGFNCTLNRLNGGFDIDDNAAF